MRLRKREERQPVYRCYSIVSGDCFACKSIDNTSFLIIDLCDSQDLFDRISKHAGVFSESEAASVFSPLISSIGYCHRLGIAHRDVKPDNMLFDSRRNLKLADFGSAEWFGMNERGTMTGVVGTPYYVAPEVLSGREYNEKVDVWSAGVILYIMLAGVPPFYGESSADTFEAVLRGNLRFPTKLFRSISPEAKDLLRKMMCKDVPLGLEVYNFPPLPCD
ncbi:hypothetical protein SSX86_024106 [Deinandra increscens subsp. villosa]|uniref:Protein kinase domain-containing protein n=1 Tax=Deinandra increscens subsp. villosa TaxID=3103831 RepID=A0AAP0GND5_9ASTR